MPLKPLKLALVSALLVGSSVASALPFNSFDPRSMAMGGAGVAMGDAAMAPFFNPALLAATKAKNNFSLVLPIVGARVYDPENFSTSVNNFQNGNYVSKLQASIDAFNLLTPTAAQATAVATDTTALNTQLATLDGKPVQAEFGAAMVIGIPSKKYGGAFFASGSGALGGVVNYRDGQTLTDLAQVATDVAACDGGDAAACSRAGASPYFNSTTGDFTFTTNQLQSKINIRGVAKAETGISLARKFTLINRTFSAGISPKIVKLLMFDFISDMNTGLNLTGDDYRAEYTNFNFDFGVARDYKDGWRSGFVVKNVIPYSYDFKKAPTPGALPVATGATLKLKPQARVGASRKNKWSTVALDVDITRNDPVGLEDKSQYIALGGELNVLSWAKIRAGYRADIVNSKRNVASLGLGLALFKVVHVDIAAAGNKNEMGASFQLGVRF